MSDQRQRLGQKGEGIAADFLVKNGYTLVEQNYRTRNAELDIIAREGGCLCFVEVKTRTSITKGLPKESVHQAKQRKIISGALFYLKENQIVNQRVRFDVVEISFQDQAPEVTLIKNAFGEV